MKTQLSLKQRLKAFFIGTLCFKKNQPKKIIEDDISAKLLLSLLQKKGRFIDFLYHNLDHYNDEQIANVARTVHENCKEVLENYFRVAPIRNEKENSAIKLSKEFDRNSINLIGNIGNKYPITGILIHKGWKIESFELPTISNSSNSNILQPAEIEVV